MLAIRLMRLGLTGLRESAWILGVSFCSYYLDALCSTCLLPLRSFDDCLWGLSSPFKLESAPLVALPALLIYFVGLTGLLSIASVKSLLPWSTPAFSFILLFATLVLTVWVSLITWVSSDSITLVVTFVTIDVYNLYWLSVFWRFEVSKLRVTATEL